MADRQQRFSVEVKVALIGAATTVLVAIIAAVVTIATTHGSSPDAAPSPSPAQTQGGPTSGGGSTSSSGSGQPVGVKGVTVDAAGARVHEQLWLGGGANVDFDAGRPWKVTAEIGRPDDGQDFGWLRNLPAGGVGGGFVAVPTEQPLGRDTCARASGYAEGFGTAFGSAGTAYCVRTTEGAFYLLVTVSTGDPAVFDLYSW